MTFNKTEWQREYRKRKKMEQLQNQQDVEQKPEELDPELSMEEKPQETEEKPEAEQEEKPKKKVREEIKKAPQGRKKKSKFQTVPLNPEAFARFSIGIEKVTLNFHKDKELKPHEEALIETSAEQLAELYEVPKIIVVIQYIAAMALPHATRLMNAHAEKIELENEQKKMEIEEKKRQIEEGRKQIKPEEVYKSVMGDKHED